jgi:hypothetical protein
MAFIVPIIRLIIEHIFQEPEKMILNYDTKFYHSNESTPKHIGITIVNMSNTPPDGNSPSSGNPSSSSNLPSSGNNIPTNNNNISN